MTNVEIPNVEGMTNVEVPNVYFDPLYGLCANSQGLVSEVFVSGFGSEDRDFLAHHFLALSSNRGQWGKNMVGKNI
jgi:hypothetical protein